MEGNALAALSLAGNPPPSGNVAYVNADWLEWKNPTEAASQTFELTTTAVPLNSYWYSPNYCWGYHTETKIRLALSEVERLRTAARNDAKLKKILAKFAPHIEIVVDFE